MAGELSIGTLSGTVELVDNASTTLDKLVNKVDQLTDSVGGATSGFVQQTAAMFTAQGAYDLITGSVKKLGDELEVLTYQGAKVAEVEANFNRLATGAGHLADTLLGTLQQGTHNTIANFELIKTANQDLAAGMNLTDKQFSTLSQGAYALAKATGQDVASAMATVNDAMLTGRVRALALLTGKIDLKSAEDKFAASLNTTADHLSAEGKIEASRQAILEAVEKATARLGTQTEGLAEKVDQASAKWHNFEEDLGKTIATNPAVLAAFDSVGKSLTDAFGGDKEALIKNVSDIVGTLATVMADTVKVALALKDVLIPIGAGLTAAAVAGTLYVGAMTAMKLASTAVTFALGEQAAAESLVTKNLGVLGLAVTVFTAAYEGTTAILHYFNKAQDDANAKTQAYNESVYAAEKAQRALGEATVDSGKAADDQSKFVQESKKEIDEAAAAAKKLAEINKEITEVSKDWTTTLKAMDPVLVKNVEHLDKNGISMSDLKIKYHLTDAEVNALTKDMEAQQKVLDKATKAAEEHAKVLALIHDATQDWHQVAAQVPDVLAAQVLQLQAEGLSVDQIADALDHQLTPAQIRAVEAENNATTAAANHAKALADERDSLGLTTKALIAQAEAQDAASQAARDAGGSTEVNRGNLPQEAAYWGIPEVVAETAAEKGFSFSEILQAWQSGTISQWVPHGPRIPGFKEGGYGDFGDGTLAMLHGKEIITPIDKVPTGGDTFNFYVNGTGTEIVNMVANELMTRQKLRRKYGSA